MESSGDRLEGTKGQTRQCTASDHSNDTSASKEAHGMRRKRQVKGSKTTFKINLRREIDLLLFPFRYRYDEINYRHVKSFIFFFIVL